LETKLLCHTLHGVGLLFVLLIAAWSVMLFVASRHPTATVPLETVPSAPEKTAGG
jgi:hypothetical protein